MEYRNSNTKKKCKIMHMSDEYNIHTNLYKDWICRKKYMAIDDFLISTGLDNLILLVKEKGRIELGQAAKELKIPIKTVEDWAHVLEEEGIVKLEYKLMQVFLIWQKPSQDYVEKKSKNLELRANSAKAGVEMLLSKVEEGGKNLDMIQKEISMLSSTTVPAGEIKGLKTEIANLQNEYSDKIKSASNRLEKLRKEALTSAQTLGKEKEGTKKTPPEKELTEEISVLHRLEEALESQLADTETFFGEYETKLNELQQGVEQNKTVQVFDKISTDIKTVRSLKQELGDAIDAIHEEHAALEEKIKGLENAVSKIKGVETPAVKAKKIAEIKKLSEEAKKQKLAVEEQLEDALSSLKKQTSKFENLFEKHAENEGKMESLKNEYVDIATDIESAKEDLVAREKEIADKLTAQMTGLDAKQVVSIKKISGEELEKISFLFRELKREQTLLEEKIHSLAKEAEILKIEATETPVGETTQKTESAPAALVEKVRLSEEEADEFERKRYELRTLIQKMWEENKGGRAK